METKKNRTEAESQEIGKIEAEKKNHAQKQKQEQKQTQNRDQIVFESEMEK